MRIRGSVTRRIEDSLELLPDDWASSHGFTERRGGAGSMSRCKVSLRYSPDALQHDTHRFCPETGSQEVWPLAGNRCRQARQRRRDCSSSSTGRLSAISTALSTSHRRAHNRPFPSRSGPRSLPVRKKNSSRPTKFPALLCRPVSRILRAWTCTSTIPIYRRSWTVG